MLSIVTTYAEGGSAYVVPSAAAKAGGNPNFGLNMPLMCSAFDTSAWLNAA